MNIKPLLPLLFAAALAGCASTSQVAGNDPVRARVQAELAQARADGALPLSEADYVYPNWAAPHKAP